MLCSNPRTNCQQFVLWVTDEGRTDDDVRCGPGRYQQVHDSTVYHPGPICRWTRAYESTLSTVMDKSVGKVCTTQCVSVEILCLLNVKFCVQELKQYFVICRCVHSLSVFYQKTARMPRR